MRFIIEFDGSILDVAPAYYQAHGDVAAQLGWSRLDQETFWRVVRKDGDRGNFLRGAKPAKIKDYHTRFTDHIETDEIIERFTPHPIAKGALTSLARHGACALVCLGANVEARRRLITRSGFADCVAELAGLSSDPRRRPGELAVLALGDARIVVAAASDTLIRAASSADLFTVGIASGSCKPDRLHQAGAAIVYRNLQELLDSLDHGAQDLIQAGLLPPPLG